MRVVLRGMLKQRHVQQHEIPNSVVPVPVESDDAVHWEMLMLLDHSMLSLLLCGLQNN